MLRQDDPRTKALAVKPVVALTNAVEPIAWSNHPGIVRTPLQILAEIFEDCGIVRRHSGKIVERLVDAGCQTGGCYVVPEDAAIHNLGEECGLGEERPNEIGNILL